MKPITEKLEAGLSTSVFPGAVLLVAHKSSIIYHQAAGFTALSRQKKHTTCNTYFDLASLTKPLVTTAAIAILLQEKQLALQDPVNIYLTAFAGEEKNEVTIFHLLNHSAGLPAWQPYYQNIVEKNQKNPGYLGSNAAKRAVFLMAQKEQLIARPGEKSLYSDIGFILLQNIIETVSQNALDVFFDRHIRPTLPLSCDAFFRPIHPESDGKNNLTFAATEDIPWRQGIVEGIVHDDNAFAMGGIAGHAGLFSTALGVYHLTGLWQQALYKNNKLPSLFTYDTARLFTSRRHGGQSPTESSWGLGWDTPSLPIKPGGTGVSSSGHFFSPESFGHLGFTGTSVWIDPKHELTVVFLCNRVHPDRDNNAIRYFRPELHDIIFKEVIHG